MSAVFSQYIKIIGKGQKGSRSLTRDEAYTAMKMVLNGEVTGDQRGAFLMLLRTREETPDEVIGFLQACREMLYPEVAALPVSLDIGCYAGKRRQLPWYLLSAACLAQAGINVFLHGAHEPGSGRLYASLALPELGLPLAGSASEAAAHLAHQHAAYLDLGDILPALNTIIKLRDVFGLRSCANTLGRLLNPSAAPASVQGVFHTHLDHKHGQVNEAFEQYQSLCFRGDGGDPEVNSERETELFITRNGQTATHILPASEGQWALKDKAMDVQTMLSFWRGELSHRYAEQAVQATLTAYLMLLDDSGEVQAAEKASLLWQRRDTQRLPFSAES